MSLAEPIACCAPLAAPTLSDEEAEGTAALFRALGDPARVRIVNMLATAGGEVCGCGPACSCEGCQHASGRKVESH